MKNHIKVEEKAKNGVGLYHPFYGNLNDSWFGTIKTWQKPGRKQKNRLC